VRFTPAAELPDVVLIEPRVHRDERGFFLESYQRERFAAAGLDLDFVQDNHSRSTYGILRGLHFQHPRGQGKLIRAIRGEVYDVAVDIRVGSPTFGRWAGFTLSEENHRLLYIPPGFAHGFDVTSAEAYVCYKCTGFYHPEDEGILAWDDMRVGINWPIAQPRLSDKDSNGVTLLELERAGRLPSVRTTLRG
jgi:dTDP-4-dehydrorhamnose 3,5-epimerase